MQDPLAYLYSSDPDTMYFDKAMKQPDRKELMNAAIREVNRHFQLKHWKPHSHKESPKEKPILYSV